MNEWENLESNLLNTVDINDDLSKEEKENLSEDIQDVIKTVKREYTNLHPYVLDEYRALYKEIMELMALSMVKPVKSLLYFELYEKFLQNTRLWCMTPKYL